MPSEIEEEKKQVEEEKTEDTWLFQVDIYGSHKLNPHIDQDLPTSD